MKQISASDANRGFSSLLREVAAGKTVTIVSRHKPVATIAPVRPGVASARQAARRRLVERLRQQPAQPAAGGWRRSDLYDEA